MSSTIARKALHAAIVAALAAAGVASSSAVAGGLLLYEVGTAEVGLASAGFGARAQDASTVFTNPAGMTRLDGNQATVAGQLLWANTKFSIDGATSPALGNDNGGYAIGSNGWFLGGGAFGSWTVTPDIKLGIGTTGNFGAALKYNDDWVGRYHVKETAIVGFSLLPSIAWKATDKLSLGASLNAMYGIYSNKVAVNNADPLFGDGQLELKNQTWGFGGNLGMLYEFDPSTRFSLTWNSQVSLDFSSPARFSGLAPATAAALDHVGLLNNTVNIGIKVPQQLMGSVFTQLNPTWALLGSVGWQQWSKFGQVEAGLENAINPAGGLTTSIPFKDTWHGAIGAQYRPSEPWLINFGIAYDSGFQPNSTVSPLLPLNWGWRFGTGLQQQLSKDSNWGMSLEYVYGGSLDVNETSRLPVIAGGRGDLVGSYNNIGSLFIATYYSWKF